MTYRDFFLTIVKLAGLIAFAHAVNSFVSSQIWMMLEQNIYLYIYFVTGWVAFIGVVMIFLLFSHKIVDLIALDKQFMSKKIEFANIEPKELFRIGLILICCFLFAQELVTFIIQSFYALQKEGTNVNPMYFNRSVWLISLGTVIIVSMGFIYNQQISEYIYKTKDQ